MNNDIQINKISWDRIWIHFHVGGFDNIMSYDNGTITSSFNQNSASERNFFHLFLCGINSDFKAELLPSMDDRFTFRLNITNPGNCEMLPTGYYKLYYSIDNYVSYNPSLDDLSINISSDVFSDAFSDASSTNDPSLLPLEVSDSLNVSKSNRQFVYFHKERAYRVQFSKRNGFKIKVSDIELGGRTFVQRISSKIRRSRHNLAKFILRSIYKVLFILFHRKKRINNEHSTSARILLMSDQSEEMGSNMAALKRALIREGYKPKEALRAVTTKHYNILSWIRTLKKIAETDYIFLDDHSQTTDWLTIKGAVITQLWHAGAGFKSTGYSRFGMPASPAPKSGHRQYTYGIAGSKKIRHFFSEVWGINDDMVLPTGMPRLDEFLDKKYIAATKRKLSESYPELQIGDELCKPSIILFAPTYRGENKKNAYYPFEKLNLEKLYKMCEKLDALFIFRMHPFVSEHISIPKEYSGRLIDMSDYENINDLFYITDLLITDYSSNIYEFSLMKKPMLFFAYDIKEYAKERGFHRDYKDNVPGKIVETFDDMCKAIEEKDFEFEKVEKYLDKNFDHVDTGACNRIIDWIIRGNMPQKNETSVPGTSVSF